MNDGDLILDDRLDEVLLYRFYIAQLGTFPLIAVVHSVVPVSVYIDASTPVVVPALLIQ
jgi:hypothetical protein